MRGPAVFAIAAVLTLAAGGYLYLTHMMAAQTPAGLSSANGRIEVTRVDIASKLPGRAVGVLKDAIGHWADGTLLRTSFDENAALETA